MPSVGGTGEVAPQLSAAATADPVLAAERDQLRRSREFLRLMREDVLSLRAMGGDPVSEEYLKAELYHRAEALKDIPDAPLFFGRLDYAEHPATEDDGVAGHRFHIGRRHVHAPDARPRSSTGGRRCRGRSTGPARRTR